MTLRPATLLDVGVLGTPHRRMEKAARTRTSMGKTSASRQIAVKPTLTPAQTSIASPVALFSYCIASDGNI